MALRLKTLLPILALLALAVAAAWLVGRQQRLVERQAALERTLAEQQAEIDRLSAELRDRPQPPEPTPGPPSPAAPGAIPPAAALPLGPTGSDEAFRLGVLQMVLDAVGRRDATRQRALVGYLAGLPDRRVRQEMLMLLRDEASDRQAAKQAGALLGRAIEAVAPIAGEAAVLPFGEVAAGRAEGWDYDLFVCRSSLERRDPYLEDEIGRLLDSLRAADPRHGRIRLSPLEPAVRQQHVELEAPGLFLLTDPDRSEEARQAASVIRRLAYDGYEFTTRSATGAPSPWYLGLFYCPS